MEKSVDDKKIIPAELCSCVDNKTSTLHMEFKIPGVQKEDIDFKLNDDRFNLKAEKSDIEYVSTGRFICPVEIQNIEANYKNGLLNIDIPLKDCWKDAHHVTIH